MKGISMTVDELMQYIDSQHDTMMDLWENIVRLESWSSDTEGVRRLEEHLDTYYRAMGLHTKKYEFPPAGPALAVCTDPGSLKPVALMAHMDTVHKPGSFGDELFVRDGEFIKGPGVYDCKGGLVVATLVIKALQQYGYNKRQLKLLLTSDEETAHGISKGEGAKLYYEEGSGCACAFNCESGMMNGDMVTVRKGAGVWKMTVHGIAAHAGRELYKGANAILEAAKKIEKIQAMNDGGPVGWNVGTIQGGTGSNVVPDKCEAVISVRFETNQQFDEAKAKLQAICDENIDPRTTTELEQNALFRAMEPVPKTAALVKKYQDACAQLGYDIPAEISSGGCSDASYMTMQGIPALCAIGVRGADNHARTERAVEASLTEMAKKIVLTILNLEDDF